MIYEYEITVPAGTTAAAPVVQVLKLTHGVIHHIEVIFRAGCHHEVSLTINRAIHQVYPTNPDGVLKGDWFPISGPVWHEISEAPYQLEARGWAPDTTYDHTVIIRLWIQRRETLLPGEGQASLLTKLSNYIMGRRG
jgi:hypothetical protein